MRACFEDSVDVEGFTRLLLRVLRLGGNDNEAIIFDSPRCWKLLRRQLCFPFSVRPCDWLKVYRVHTFFVVIGSTDYRDWLDVHADCSRTEAGQPQHFRSCRRSNLDDSVACIELPAIESVCLPTAWSQHDVVSYFVTEA